MELLCAPVRTRCAHVFCELCLATWAASRPTCPVCRASLSAGETPPWWEDRDVAAAIEAAWPGASTARRAAHEAADEERWRARRPRCLADGATSSGVEQQLSLGRFQASVERAFLLLPRQWALPPSVRGEAWHGGPTRLRSLGFNVSAPSVYAQAFELLELERGHTFLDVGSGCGLFTAMAALLVGRQGVAHGLELRVDAIDFAARNVAMFREQLVVDKTAPFRRGQQFDGVMEGSSERMRITLRVTSANESGAFTGELTRVRRTGLAELGRTLVKGTCSPDGVIEFTEEAVLSGSADVPCDHRLQRAGERDGQPTYSGVWGSPTIAHDDSVGATRCTLTGCSFTSSGDAESMDVVSFHKGNVFNFQPPIAGGMYDRIHVGAQCPTGHEHRLYRLLKPGGMLVAPINDSMTRVVKDENGECHETQFTAVRYGELILPGRDEPAAPMERSQEGVLRCKACKQVVVYARDVTRLSPVLGEELALHDGARTLFCRDTVGLAELEPDRRCFPLPEICSRVSAAYCKGCDYQLGVRLEANFDRSLPGEDFVGSTLLTRRLLYSAPEPEPDDLGRSANWPGSVELPASTPLRCSARGCGNVFSNSRQVLSNAHLWDVGDGTEPAAFINALDSGSYTTGEPALHALAQGPMMCCPIYCAKCEREVGWQFIHPVHADSDSLGRLGVYLGRFGIVLSRLKRHAESPSNSDSEEEEVSVSFAQPRQVQLLLDFLRRFASE